MRFSLVLFVALIVMVPVAGTGSVLILDYHTFLGHGPSEMDYSLQEFGDQLDKIQALGYHFVSLTDAMDGKLEGDKNIALTIDDGHVSSFEAVTKVVFPRKIPVQLFVFPGPIDRSVHYLKLAELKSLLSEGADLGAHGYFHNYMSPTAWAKSPESVLFEAQRPAQALERMTGIRPRVFAYPFGVAAREAVAAVQEQGYQWAFLANGSIRPVDPNDPHLNRWAIPRTIMYRSGLKKLFAYLAAGAGTTTPLAP